MTKLWPSRVMAFLLWLVVAATATYWILKIAGLTRATTTSGVVVPEAPTAAPEDLARVLGPSNAGAVTAAGVAIVPAMDPGSRMRLLGVVADRRHAGVALISLNGEPPRPYRVGSELEGGYKLTGVATRTATLSPAGQGTTPITLELIPAGAAGSSASGAAANGGLAGVNALLSSLRRPATPQSIQPGLTETPAPQPPPAMPDNPETPAKE
jgi:general secretion pathway protein C